MKRRPTATLYMGIDLSLRGTGISIIDKDKIVNQFLISTTPKQVTEGRLIEIGDTIKKILKKYPPILINIEGLAFGARGQRMFELAGLHYYIRIMVKQLEYPYIVTPPTEVKKWVTGKGNCNKDVMLMKVFKKYGIEFTDNNLCDAFCLARYGEFINAKR